MLSDLTINRGYEVLFRTDGEAMEAYQTGLFASHQAVDMRGAQYIPNGWHMHDWMSWWGPWPMLFPLLVLIGVIAGIVFLIQNFPLDRGSDGSGRTAAEFLDERYAKGEINREEYLRRKQDIRGV
jgi:putative membrane protein